MSIQRHTIYNLSGTLAPMVVSLATVPIFLHLIGNDRYGVLAIVWLFLGYFGLFDPGISKAAEYHIARLHEADDAKERESIFWTALVVNFAFGLAAGVALYLVARPIFVFTFKMPEVMRGEVIASLPWLAASLPISITTGVLSGALQAREQFGVLNAIRIFNATVSQLAPLAVAYWHGPALTWLIPTVLIARTLGAIPSVVVLIPLLPLGVGGKFDRSLVKRLFSYGGWITITNVMTPLLTTMDRLLIGSLLNAAAVTFYTVPFNLVSRISALPGALHNSLFPKLTRGSREDSSQLASNALTALAAVMTPAVALGMAALPIFLRLWLGRSFAEKAASVGLILFWGIWINGLAYIPYGLLQARGRPDIVAKLHAAELVPFLGVLWLGLHFFGLEGAAFAWTLRVAADAVLLLTAAGNLPEFRRLLPGGLILAAAGLVSPTAILSGKTVLESGLIAISFLWSWRLSPVVRSVVRSRLSMLHVRESIS